MVVSSCGSVDGKKEDPLHQIRDTYKSINSVAMSSVFTVKVNNKESKQLFDAETIYEDKKLVKAHAVSKKSGANNSSSEVVLTTDGNNWDMYKRSGVEKDWQKSKGDYFYIQPDYIKVLDIFYSIKDSFVLEENDKEYKFVFDQSKDESVDIFNLFKEQFMLSVTGIRTDELEKEMTFIFDKNTKNLKKVVLVLQYNGKLGELKTTASVDYYDWNKIDGKLIDGLVNK